MRTRFRDAVKEAGRDRFLGEVLKAREMTVQEFDQMRGRRLAERLGPGREDEPIFFLEVDDLGSLSGRTRSAIFFPEPAPVSKWSGFERSLRKIHFELEWHDDGTTNLEGKAFWFVEFEKDVGPYQPTRTLEVDAIATPEEVREAKEKRAAALKKRPPTTAAQERTPVEEIAPSLEEVKDMVLSVCDGKSTAEIVAELAEMAVQDASLITQAIGTLLVEKKIVSRENKFWIKKEA